MIIYKKPIKENRFEIVKNDNEIIPVYNLVDDSIQEVIAESDDKKELEDYITKKNLVIIVQSL